MTLRGYATIAIVCFQGESTWSKKSIRDGIGGSEEAVIYMSDELSRRGYRVTVYNGKSDEIVNDKLKYVPFSHWNTHPVIYDIVIMWRNYKGGTMGLDFGNKVYLWFHDICITNNNKEFLFENKDIYGILWLTKWQRQNYVNLLPCLKDTEEMICGNGIVREQFDKDILPRDNPWSCIYSSNCERGLIHLLRAWPLIKEYFPKATLDIYYDWVFYVYKKDDIERLKFLLDSNESYDVKYHGKVGQDELHEKMRRTSLWIYTNTFAETFCITAIKMQASGVYPISTREAGLQETVLFGEPLPDQPKRGHQDLYKQWGSDCLHSILRQMGRAQNITIKDREIMRDTMLNHFTWKHVADRWESIFNKNTKFFK